MDVTFGDPVFYSAESGEKLPENVINYDYLCCTDAEIAVDHVQNSEVRYPACSQDDLNYYRLEGMYYDAYDPQLLLNAMNESIYAGEPMFVCKFRDHAVYSEAKEGMVNDLFPKAARTVAAVYGLQNVRYTYIESGEHCRITVIWETEQ